MSFSTFSPKSLGRHFVVGLSSSELSASERRLLKELEPAGVILFAYNFEKDNPDWPQQTLQLRREVEAIVGAKILFSIDHEGGKVHRLPPPATRFPAARNWPDSALAVGQAMGAELHALGFNLNFAPVLDVDSEAQNPIIGSRSFSKDPMQVAQAGVEFIRGMQQFGVAACGKHFPGHGATTKDSHLTLPSVNDARDIIFNRDIAPFIAAINSGLPLLMTAHVVYPELDSDRPATVSKKILTEILRTQLKYQGTIISDALEMKALDYLSRSDLAESALQAGVDLLLLGQNRVGSPLEDALQMAEDLAQKCKRSELLLTACKEGQQRISRLLSFVESLESRAEIPGGTALSNPNHLELLKRITRGMPE